MATTKTPAKAPAKTGSSARSSSANAGKKNRANLLTVKRQLRRTRPVFTRHRPDRKASLADNWRKPRGLHNKLKDRKRGCGPWIADGYRTPEAVRGFHISGLAIAHVANRKELDAVDATTHGVVIARVGAKRQLELLAVAKEKGVRVLNHKADARVAELTAKFTAAKQERKAARAAAEAKASTQTKKEKAKPAKQDAPSADEKRDEQEKIKEEVLTSKNQ
jgi:large subunit ribosomal protein L32e